jgi:hypothetical protein
LVVLAACGQARRAAGEVLRERVPVGQVTKVTIALEAEGRSLPQPSEGKQKERSFPLKVQGRFEGWERVLEVDRDSRARKVVRKVQRAAAAINTELRPTTSALRPEMALLVAERRGDGVRCFSPAGPLTRHELEVVQWSADPLTLASLLPPEPVAVGQAWDVVAEGARAVSGYDALASNSLKGTLEALDEATARIRFAGKIGGATLGAEGSIDCEGVLIFDRQAGRVRRLELTRHEVRQPGQVESGLDIRSTLTVERTADEPPAELTDTALASVPLTVEPTGELLQFIPPGAKYRLLHGRDWHIFYEDERQTVLKWLDQGELVAQCNLALGPNAGRGRHQDPKQFQDDIQRAMGKRFRKILFAGPVEGPDDGVFRFRVGVQGQVDNVEVLWIYYLVASPEGDQLLATYTLAQAQAERFNDQDLRMIGTLIWTSGAESAEPRTRP